MSIPPPAYCMNCRHYVGLAEEEGEVTDNFVFVCEAFPEGIPNGIIDGRIDHSQPVEGDNGYRFEPVSPQGPLP